MKIDFDKLEDALRFAVVKKNKKSGFGKTSSIAYSKNNRNYTAGNLASDTNLLDITSEQAALVLAVLNNDFQINKIITLVEEKNHQQVVSPLVLKILRDFEVRTGTKIRYIIVNKKEDILFDIKDISSIMSFYNPSIKILTKTKRAKISKNWITAILRLSSNTRLSQIRSLPTTPTIHPGRNTMNQISCLIETSALSNHHEFLVLDVEF